MRQFFLLLLLSITELSADEIKISVNWEKPQQQIANIGSSTGMYGCYIGGKFKEDRMAKLAELIFSRETDAQGRPKGIALSSFRVELGAGTAGNSKGIKKLWRRTESYLNPDGSYDWKRPVGSNWWIKAAHRYQVNALIGYANSAPVFWNRNSLGFKTERSMKANLKSEHFGDYAAYLAQIASHFEKQGTPLHFISPVNEPQWDWSGTPGDAKQEGSPWTNGEMSRVAGELDKAFQKKRSELKYS